MSLVLANGQVSALGSLRSAVGVNALISHSSKALKTLSISINLKLRKARWFRGAGVLDVG